MILSQRERRGQKVYFDTKLSEQSYDKDNTSESGSPPRIGERGIRSTKVYYCSDTEYPDVVEPRLMCDSVDNMYEYIRVPKRKNNDIPESSNADKVDKHQVSGNVRGGCRFKTSPLSCSEMSPQFLHRSKRAVVYSRDEQNNDRVIRNQRRFTEDLININAQPIVREEVVKVHQPEQTPNAMNYRSNIQSCVKDIRSFRFTPRHIEAIKRTPFWLFVNSALNMDDHAVYMQFKKRDQNITRILKRFHSQNSLKGFLFGDTFVVPSRDDVELIFGVRDGTVPVKPGTGSVRVTGFLRRCFPAKVVQRGGEKVSSQYKMSPALLKRTLGEKIALGDNAPAEDVGRILHLYLLASFFIPNQNLSLNWRVTEMVDDFDSICYYDWCSFIIDEMMCDIYSSINFRIGSCAVLLLFWICEHTQLISPVKNCQSIPRYMKWDLNVLAKRFSNLDLDRLDEITDIIGKISATPDEAIILDEDIDALQTSACKSPVEVPEDNEAETDIQNSGVDGHTDYALNLSSEADAIVSPFPPNPTRQDNELPSFSLGFGETTHNVVSKKDKSAGCMSLLDKVGRKELSGFDGTLVKITSPAGEKVSVHFESPGRPSGSRQLFQKVDDDIERTDRIHVLEKELESKKLQVLKLQCDLEVKDKAKAAEDSFANRGFREASKDLIDCLRADFAECEHIKDRLFHQNEQFKKDVKALEDEKWRLGDKLSLEIAKTSSLSDENEKMKKESIENHSRKTRLLLENERLKADVTRLNRELDDVLQLPPGERDSYAPMNSSSQIKLDKFPVLNLDSQTPSSIEQKTSIDSKPTSSIELASATSLKTPDDVNKAPYGGIPGLRLFATPDTSTKSPSTFGTTLSSLRNSLNGKGAAACLPPRCSSVSPVTVKIEPVDNLNVSSGVLIKSDSPDSENTMVARIQERTLIDARRKKNLVSPIPLAFTNAGKRPVKFNEIRPLHVDRESVAYQKTLPYYTSWLIKKSKNTAPCTSLLAVENSYMNNYVTIENFEALLNHEGLSDSIIDTWGMLVNQIANCATRAKETRNFVARQTYLFRSFCWLYVARYDVEHWYKAMTTQFIDKKILDALRFETWIFPINTPGRLDPRKHEGNHWTLLKFSVSSCSWVFYNPLSPVDTAVDEHYNAALTLVSYVERQIKQSGCGMRIPILRHDFQTKVVRCNETPQQAEGTLDCGVVVCKLIEAIVRKDEIKKELWSQVHGGNVRASIVGVLCEAAMDRE